MTGFRRFVASRTGRWLAVVVLALLMFCLGVWAASDREHHEHGQNQATNQASSVWTCSMHPSVRQNEPGKCPICGMDLIAVDDKSTGVDVVALSERAKVKARIRTAVVAAVGGEGAQRRLLGRVAVDESTLKTVTSWVGGRIDRLSVRTTGENVRRGQVIATLYSPEVFSAHQDLIAAATQRTRLGASATTASQTAAQAALEASRQRLRLLGVPEAEVDALEKASKPSDRIRIRSPYAGTVIERLATEGSYVQTGAGLYRLADLRSLWVELDAYESDLPMLDKGQRVKLRVDGRPEQLIEGEIRFIDPVLDPRSRTARVRVEVSNHEGDLRPGMFVEAQVAAQGIEEGSADEKPPLVVPSTAPLFTGQRSLVYVEVSDAELLSYQPREVRLGAKVGDSYLVLSGLEAGERVVVHGAFAIDADLQIRGGDSMMTRVGATSSDAQQASLPAQAKPALAAVFETYLQLHEALAADAHGRAKEAANRLLVATARVDESVQPSGKRKDAVAVDGEFVSTWRGLSSHLNASSAQIGATASLGEARAAFATLSRDIATLLTRFGNPTQHELRLAHCPMAFDGQGGEWIQRAESIANPYFGKDMHGCGEIQHALAEGAYLPSTHENTASQKEAAEHKP